MFGKAFKNSVLLFLFFSTGIIAMGNEPCDTATFLTEHYLDPDLHLSPQMNTFDQHSSLDQAIQEEAIVPRSIDNQEYVTRTHRRGGNSSGQAIGNIITSSAKDIFVLHKNLFTWNTFKVICTAFPFFIAARMIDEKLQRCFYDSNNKKNINQMPDWCHTVAKTSIAVPLVFLGSDLFFSKSKEKQWTAQIMLLGMPFVIWTKKLVKQMKFDVCLRPWHEKLTCGKKRSFGGFPSGHMAQALYMAVLYGTRYGPRYAVPLSGLAAFIGVTFLTCNRHYLSQLIAGGAFGTIYALAANKLVEKKLTDQVKLGLQVDHEGRPSFSASVHW
jgi:hypothetical protein